MKLNPPVRAKLRSLLETFQMAQAMKSAASERKRESAEDLLDARREHDKLKSADERKRWVNVRGPHAPGTLGYDDMLEKSEAKLARLLARDRAAAATLDKAEKFATMLQRPLERIASHLKLGEILHASANPLRQLEDLL